MTAVKVLVIKRTRKRQVNIMKIIVGELPLIVKVTQGCEGKIPSKRTNFNLIWDMPEAKIAAPKMCQLAMMEEKKTRGSQCLSLGGTLGDSIQGA